MMSFVMVFDKAHWKKCLDRFISKDLLTTDEMDQLMVIWAACQEN